MRLVYEKTGVDVKVGDIVTLASDRKVRVIYFREPHKSSSSGHVTVRSDEETYDCNYFVGVIGATWIDREDQR